MGKNRNKNQKYFNAVKLVGVYGEQTMVDQMTHESHAKAKETADRLIGGNFPPVYELAEMAEAYLDLTAQLAASDAAVKGLLDAVKYIALGHDGRCSYEDLGCYQCKALEALKTYREALKTSKMGSEGI